MPKIYLTPSFLESLSKLSKNDHHRTNQTILKMMGDINLAGLRFHRVHDYTSISSGMDLRIICSQWKDGYALNYVDHHDTAYLWAKNHTLVSNESNSFLEYLPHIDSQVAIQKTTPQIPMKNDYGVALVDRLSGRGLPELLLRELYSMDSEDALLDTIQDFSPHLQEIILNAATGATTDETVMGDSSRVVVINDDEELERALKYPLDHWRLFLHPIQADIINQDYLKKIAIVGGPGTGKTIVLVHRAVKLFKENKKVLLITKTRELAAILVELINKLISNHNIVVAYFPSYGNESPDYWVRGNEIGKMKINLSAPYKLRLMLTSDWKYNTAEVHRIDHILFDEAQDLHNSVELKWIAELLKLSIGITISIDCNQTIYPANPMEILEVLNTDTITKYPLNYCYRSTKEILKYAKEISKHAINIHKIVLSHKKDAPTEKIDTEIARLHYEKYQVAHTKPQKGMKAKALRRFKKSTENKTKKIREKIMAIGADKKRQLASKKMDNQKTTKMFSSMPLFSSHPLFYGLTGSPIKKIISTEKNLSVDINKKVKELKKTYNTKGIAILVPNEENVHQVKAWVSEIEIITFKQAKGLEWFAGIVIIDEHSIIQNQLDSLPTLNSSNALYVAVTRFREMVTIIALKSSNDFKLETEKIK